MYWGLRDGGLTCWCPRAGRCQYSGSPVPAFRPLLPGSARVTALHDSQGSTQAPSSPEPGSAPVSSGRHVWGVMSGSSRRGGACHQPAGIQPARVSSGGTCGAGGPDWGGIQGEVRVSPSAFLPWGPAGLCTPCHPHQAWLLTGPSCLCTPPAGGGGRQGSGVGTRSTVSSGLTLRSPVPAGTY